jgi:hypothetical protein
VTVSVPLHASAEETVISATGPVEGFTRKLWQRTTGAACRAHAAENESAIREMDGLFIMGVKLRKLSRFTQSNRGTEGGTQKSAGYPCYISPVCLRASVALCETVSMSRSLQRVIEMRNESKK